MSANLIIYIMLQVESIVLKRYGREACRIFKLLLQADRVVETEMVTYIRHSNWMKSQVNMLFFFCRVTLTRLPFGT